MSDAWPDLTVLQLLVGVAEHGSLGAAARAVSMAQPNASRAVSRLERRLGLTLIRRTPTGSTLTPEGTVVGQWARDVLTAAEHLLVAAQALSAERRSQLSVAASMTVAEYLVPAWLGELRRTHPDLQLGLEVTNSSEVCGRVASGSSHVGFVESPGVPQGLHSAVVARDRLVVVVDPGHPWARRRRPLTPAELAATPLIVRERGSGTRITLERLLHAYELAAPALELTSTAAVKVSVASGAAPAVVSTLAVEASVRSGELVAVPVEGLDLSRRLRAVWRPPRHLDGPAGDLVLLARRSGVAAPEAR